MFRIIIVAIVVITGNFIVNAQSVHLSGTVTEAGSVAGIEGVNVSLINRPELTAMTNADGVFSIEETAVRMQQRNRCTFQFTIKNKSLVFLPASRNVSGKMAVFSSDGKQIFSIECISSPEGTIQEIPLPELGSGIAVMRMTLNGETFVRRIVSVGSELFFQDGSSKSAVGTFSLMKQAAAAVVDTLVALKEGYESMKVPIDSYVKEGISISLQPTGGTGGECTRETMQTLVDGYIKALEAGDPTILSLTADATYIENMEDSEMGEGIWETPLDITFHRDFFDIDSCKAFTEVMDPASDEPHEIGAQITVKGGKIAEISALVSGVGDWALDEAAAFKTRHDISSREKWTIIPEGDRDDRETIQAAGDAYLDIFDDKSVEVPWGRPCGRLEGGMYTGDRNNLDAASNRCDVGIPSGVEITDRTYVIDVEMGTVNIFCKFGGRMPDSHLFRLEKGKLRFVHTISIN